MVLNLETYEKQNVNVVVVGGRIASNNAPEFGDFLRDIIIHSDAGQIVLDLAGLDYLSSAGLREIVAALKLAKQKGGDVRMASVQERLQMLFDIAGLPSFTEIFDYVDQAIRSYQ